MIPKNHFQLYLKKSHIISLGFKCMQQYLDINHSKLYKPRWMNEMLSSEFSLILLFKYILTKFYSSGIFTFQFNQRSCKRK